MDSKRWDKGGGCALPRRCAFMSAQVGRVVGETTSYVASRTSVSAAQRMCQGGLRIKVRIF